MSPSEVYLVRVGRHDCYDRMVFDINGSEPVGFTVKYVTAALSDPVGTPVKVTGSAVLAVTIRAPWFGTGTSGHQPSNGDRTLVGDPLVDPKILAGYITLRSVVYAGSFEGVTTFAVGVRTMAPFRAFVTFTTGYRHVVIDVQH